jgi:hypothetical protein
MSGQETSEEALYNKKLNAMENGHLISKETLDDFRRRLRFSRRLPPFSRREPPLQPPSSPIMLGSTRDSWSLNYDDKFYGGKNKKQKKSRKQRKSKKSRKQRESRKQRKSRK